jgi:hypothetical protein
LHQRKLVLTLAAVLALAALVAGCGGGGSSSASSSSTADSGASESGGEAPTKAAFIKEADKICTEDEDELNKEITVYLKENGVEEEEPSEDQQAELFHSLVLPNIAKQAEEIAALTPPEGDESTIEELTDTLEEEVAEAEDESGVPGEDTLKGATDQAKAYGFKSCGS